jgi:hypothetical protein
MVVHACNSGIRRLSQEHCEFEASLVYIVRPCQKKKRKKGRKAGRKEGRKEGRKPQSARVLTLAGSFYYDTLLKLFCLINSYC